ncbi:MAG: NF038122 family metalloprotease [Cyanobacteria bacterium J06649_11]
MKPQFINKLSSFKFITPLSLTLALVSNIAPVRALQFNFTYAPETRQEVINGFEAAGRIWSNELHDTYFDADCACERDTTINIHIDFNQLPNPAGLGAARPAMLKVDYKRYLNSAFRDITSADDLIAFKNLQINQNNKGISEGFLQALGVDTTYNSYEQNLNFLQQQGFSVNTNISGIEANSNDIITAQAQDLFKQLSFGQLQTLNRNPIQFDRAAFKMRLDAASNLDFQGHDEADQVQQLDENTVIDQNGNDNNQKIWMTSGNAKALGLIDGDDQGFDGQIILSNSMFDANGNIISYSDWQAQNPQGDFIQDSVWDFFRVLDPNAEVASDKFDFLSVAKHEIGHILGFLSGVDAFKMLDIQATESDESISERDATLVSTMDLYRFSEESKQKGVFDWSSTSNPFFSIDGGETKLADFADGTSYQTSHWSEKGDANGNPLGIMNPIIGKGEKLDITDLDLQLLDVIGWNRQAKVANQSGMSDLMAIEEGNQLQHLFQVLFGIVESLVSQWLEGSVEQLTEKLATANLQETAILFNIIDRASTEQKEIWETKLTQAIMFLNQVDEEIAEKQINNTREMLKLYDYDMSRSSNNSWSSGFNFWQEIDTKTLSTSEYAETQYTGEEGIENGHSMLFNQVSTSNNQVAEVPEPSMIAGLGIMGLFGWLRRRCSR